VPTRIRHRLFSCGELLHPPALLSTSACAIEAAPRLALRLAQICARCCTKKALGFTPAPVLKINDSGRFGARAFPRARVRFGFQAWKQPLVVLSRKSPATIQPSRLGFQEFSKSAGDVSGSWGWQPKKHLGKAALKGGRLPALFSQKRLFAICGAG